MHGGAIISPSPLEGEADGVLPAVTRLLLWRRHPGGAQRGIHLVDRSTVGLRCRADVARRFASLDLH